jgi:DNA-binding CsgD family transcriptional regulator
LRGRGTEFALLDGMLAAVREGESRTLVVRGEAGIGKTALLEYIVEAASDLRVVRAAGVESEMELAFAALHQLCSPILDRRGRLPAPQREALGVVFGLSEGAAPDGFLVGLAVLSLLSEVAEERPLVCVVDDAQWLDQASARTLAFVARRLRAEPVGLVFTTREPDGELRGLPELEVEGLRDGDARALLGSVGRVLLDEQVRDRLVAETRGNPLALLELPRGLTATQLAGGFGLLDPHALPGRIEESFLRQAETLPEETRLLLLVAAAEPVGDPLLVWRAAERLGIAVSAADAETEGLLAIGERVIFRHPLVRSAVYRSASPHARRAVHLALAEVTDQEVDPDRRAWHLAAAAPGPDEKVAVELERSAGRAQARGGLAATAAFLQRSVALTQDPARRADRALAAAQASLQAGASDEALGLLAAAESGALSALQRARVDLLRGRISSATNAGSEAPAELLKAAKRLEPMDVALARGTYLDAWGAALFAGPLAHAGGSLLEVSRAARAAPRPPHAPGPCDLLLDGLAALITEGRAAGAPQLRRAVLGFLREEVSAEQWFQWGVLASSAAAALWDFESWDAVSTRQIELARGAGALTLLSIALNGQGMIATWRGDFETAASLSAEDEALKEATGTRIAPYGAMLLAAYQGRTAEASTLTEATVRDAIARGEGLGIELAWWTTAVLDNGLGRYELALTAAEQASAETPEPFISAWALPELIEAAVRSGKTRLAADALQRFAEATNAGDTDWAVGIEARSRALLSEGEVAEGLYLEAIDRLGRTRLRPELARAQLLYGEWLRRENRRVDARQELRGAYDMFASMGADGFADRARHELLATGEKVRKRSAETRDDLTPQEEQIARLARDGLSNPEIGTRLFISPRTVEWHLRKVFDKLGISSRKALHDTLPSRAREAAPA